MDDSRRDAQVFEHAHNHSGPGLNILSAMNPSILVKEYKKLARLAVRAVDAPTEAHEMGNKAARASDIYKRLSEFVQAVTALQDWRQAQTQTQDAARNWGESARRTKSLTARVNRIGKRMESDFARLEKEVKASLPH